MVREYAVRHLLVWSERAVGKSKVLLRTTKAENLMIAVIPGLEPCRLRGGDEETVQMGSEVQCLVAMCSGDKMQAVSDDEWRGGRACAGGWYTL